MFYSSDSEYKLTTRSCWRTLSICPIAPCLSTLDMHFRYDVVNLKVISRWSWAGSNGQADVQAEVLVSAQSRQSKGGVAEKLY